MAILYSYPETLELLPEDMLIGTSTIRVAGKKKNITKNFTLELLKNFILDGVTNVQWGTITGTLSNQTDLQAALNAKQGNITLTTTGSSGPATFASNVLNIPDYSTGMAVPTLNQVLTAGNTSLLDAEVNTIGVYDATELAYGYLSINNSDFTLSDSLGVGSVISRMGITFSGQMGGSSGTILLSTLTASRTYTLPNATGTVALTSDIGTWGALNYPTWTTGTPFVKMTAVGTFALDINTYLTSAVTSVGMTVPSAFSVTPSTITSSGTFAITGAGLTSQYVRGDGTLANFPTSTGGGASVSYYLNGSISQGTIGGVAYKEMNSVPVIGAGTDFTINADGYIAQFITDVGDPNKLLIPAGNWNFETYFSASSSGGAPKFYIELYKYDGATFTLIATNSATPENITGGTSIDLYFTALAVPATSLLITDRLAVRFYVIHSGRTITMHTENSHLSQIITTFSSGLTALNGLTSQVQYFAVGTAGTDFNISSATDTHTFNLPTASATNRGALSSTDWSAFNGKFNLPSLTSGSVLFSNGTTIAQDNAQLFWDDTNNRLGIGTASPTAKLQIELADNGISTIFKSLGGQIRLRGYLSANYGAVIESFNPAATLNERLTLSGSKIQLLDGNVLVNTFTDNGGKLQIKAGGALSTDIALRVRNSADTADLFQVNGLRVLVKSNFVSSTVTPVSFIYSDSSNALQIIEGSGAKYVDLGGSTTQIRTSGLLQSQITGTTAAIGLSSFAFRVQGNGQTLLDEAGVNAFVTPSALLEMKATTKGFLPPRMTNAQRIAIPTPAVGLMVYCTDVVEGLYINKSTGWTFII